jgi:hypothetical protein
MPRKPVKKSRARKKSRNVRCPPGCVKKKSRKPAKQKSRKPAKKKSRKPAKKKSRKPAKKKSSKASRKKSRKKSKFKMTRKEAIDLILDHEMMHPIRNLNVEETNYYIRNKSWLEHIDSIQLESILNSYKQEQEKGKKFTPERQLEIDEIRERGY